jgi:hypothetical protein
MLALYTVWYNYVKLHRAHRLSARMAAGLAYKWHELASSGRR